MIFFFRKRLLYSWLETGFGALLCTLAEQQLSSAVLKVEEARGADAVPGSNLVANWPLTKANRKKT